MFSKKYKLVQKKEFDLIYKKGTLFQSDYLNVHILPNSLNYSRFTIVVSKAVSNKAVERNKIKRILKNIFFSLNIKLNHSIDVIVTTLPGISTIKTLILKEKFENLFNKIN